MKFIVNADDFGISAEVNQAVYQAIVDKNISSSTIMAVGEYVQEATDMAKTFDDISFGVHLTYDGPFRFFTDEKNSKSINIKGMDFSKADYIYNEFCAQIEKIESLGVKITHLDTHHHLHRYPMVLVAMIKAAKRYKISKIRTQKILTGSFANRFYRSVHYQFLKLSGITQPSYYTDLPTLFKGELPKSSSNKVIEIMCHPGSRYNDEYYFQDPEYKHIKDKMIGYHQI